MPGDPRGVSPICISVIGRQTSALAVEPPGDCELVPAPLGHSPGALGKHQSGWSLTDERAVWKSRFPEKKFQHSIGAKKKIRVGMQ